MSEKEKLSSGQGVEERKLKKATIAANDPDRNQAAVFERYSG